MLSLGIDVGSGSVRCMLSGKGVTYTHTKDISINYDINDKSFVTQSSAEIYEAIIECLQIITTKSKITAIDGLCVTATCSMAVCEVIQETGDEWILRSFGKDGQDIIMWMDSRCQAECKELNQIVPERILLYVGGKYIPEMGLPKLKWLSNHTEQNLMCFELHEWISHLLIVGGFGSIPYKHASETDDVAMDGSIKGWSRTFLDLIGIRSGVNVGGYGLDRLEVIPLGSEIGKLSPELCQKLNITNVPTVYHGCIDCYAGWVATNVSQANTLSMIAGTSTCFVLPTTEAAESIKGIWGPFWQLLPEISVYSFGQPATGKLFERLFAKYPEINDDKFAVMEAQTHELEQEYQDNIHSLIKMYFYYGDVYGNRSPYNDFTMGEAFIDGANASKLKVSVLHEHSLKSAVVQYNLILEFLAFQTLSIMQRLSMKIDNIQVSGSQATNSRFMQLLATVTDTTVISTPTSSTFQVVEGCCLVASGHLQTRSPTTQKVFVPEQGDLATLLKTKAAVTQDFAAQQRRYRQMVLSDS